MKKILARFLKLSSTLALLVGPLTPLYSTFDNVSFGFQNQSGSLYCPLCHLHPMKSTTLICLSLGTLPGSTNHGFSSCLQSFDTFSWSWQFLLDFTWRSTSCRQTLQKVKGMYVWQVIMVVALPENWFFSRELQILINLRVYHVDLAVDSGSGKLAKS